MYREPIGMNATSAVTAVDFGRLVARRAEVRPAANVTPRSAIV